MAHGHTSCRPSASAMSALSSRIFLCMSRIPMFLQCLRVHNEIPREHVEPAPHLRLIVRVVPCVLPRLEVALMAPQPAADFSGLAFERTRHLFSAGFLLTHTPSLTLCI